MTAEEFLKKCQKEPEKHWTSRTMLIEFARFHIDQLAQKRTKLLTEFGNEFLQEGIDKAITYESILEAYPLENIQ